MVIVVSLEKVELLSVADAEIKLAISGFGRVSGTTKKNRLSIMIKTKNNFFILQNRH